MFVLHTRITLPLIWRVIILWYRWMIFLSMKITALAGAGLSLILPHSQRWFRSSLMNAWSEKITMRFPIWDPRRPAMWIKPMWKNLDSLCPKILPGILSGRFQKRQWSRMLTEPIRSTDRMFWSPLFTSQPTTWWYSLLSSLGRHTQMLTETYFFLTMIQKISWKLLLNTLKVELFPHLRYQDIRQTF